MKSSKLLAMAGLLAAAGLSQYALAAPISCGGVTSMALWKAAADGCQDQDKIYTWISNDAGIDGLSFSVTTSVNNPVLGVDTHRLTFGDFPATVNWSYNLKYSIAIDLIASPLNKFRDAGLDTSVPDAEVTSFGLKEFYTTNTGGVFSGLLGSIQSTGGVPSPNTTAIAGQTTLYINETWTVGASGTLTGSTNTFREQVVPVPEPATLTLFGLGLAGLGARARRNRKV